MTLTQLRIRDEEYQDRCQHLLERSRAEELSGVVLFDPGYIFYYTGFAFIPTERPMAFVMNAEGERAMFVPRLEAEHARADALVDRVAFYIEYPYDLHPTAVLKDCLEDMGIKGVIGADQDGYPRVFGYRGPALSAFSGAQVRLIPGMIEDQMMIKSEAELNLIRQSIIWGNLAHTLLQRYTVVGATETEVSQRAGAEATRAMLDAIGPIYRGESPYYEGAIAGYRGQIGRNAAIPHALANNLTFRPGDVLVTGAASPVWGYHSELERTMVLGLPSDEVRRFFHHMLALQDTAFAMMKPGLPCSEVDQAVRAYYDQHELMQYWKHHTGHAIGIRYHEGPFLDVGDQTIMQPGMVFTVEPGLYVPGLGGFRHSDTVVITSSGIEIMTYYPRDLESLSLPV